MIDIKKLITESLNIKDYKFKDILSENKWLNNAIETFPLIKIIVNNSEDILNERISYFIQYAEKNNINISKFDIEIFVLSSMYKLFNSIYTYCKVDDKISDLEIKTDNGKLVIRCLVERDGIKYPFSTEVIVAGGYNIQREHIRYIAHTKLASLNNSSDGVISDIKQRISNKEKINKLENELQKLKIERDNTLNEIENNSKKTDEEIGEIIKNSETDSGSFYFKDDLNASPEQIKDWRDGAIKYWKKRYIDWKKDRVKSINTQIAGYIKKIEKLK